MRANALAEGETSGGDAAHRQNKFTTLDAKVLNSCIESGAIAKYCLMEPQHRKFVGGGSKGACVEIVLSALPETFERQVLKNNPNIVDNA